MTAGGSAYVGDEPGYWPLLELGARDPGERALRCYLLAGSAKGAAAMLRITAPALRRRLSAYYRQLGVANAAQAAYLLDRDR